MPTKSKSRGPKTKSRSRKTVKAKTTTTNACKTKTKPCAKEYAPKSQHGFEPFQCLGIKGYDDVKDPMFKALYGLMVYMYDHRPDLRELVEKCAANGNPDVFMVDNIGTLLPHQLTDLPLGNLMGAFLAEYGAVHGTGTTPEDRRTEFYNNNLRLRSGDMPKDSYDPFNPFGSLWPVEAHCGGDRTLNLHFMKLAAELYQVPFTRVYALELHHELEGTTKLEKSLMAKLDLIDGPTIQAAVEVNPRIAQMVSELHKFFDCCSNNHSKPCETDQDCYETCRL